MIGAISYILGKKVVGKSLIIGDNMIISDLHLGYERALANDGIFIPTMIEDMINDIEELPDVNALIVLGDFKHEFSPKRIKGADKIIMMLKKKYDKRILIRGNHDKFIVEDVFDEIVDYMVIGDTLLVHGDRIIDVKEEHDVIVIGHEHPAYTLDDGTRKEKYKCFLAGTYEDKKIIVMPSFSEVTVGSDIRKEKILSPYVKRMKDIEYYVIGDGIYRFIG